MAKVASPAPKRVPAAKTSPAAAVSRTRTAKSPEPLPTVAAPAPVDVLAPFSARLNAVEEKITSSLSALSADLQALKVATASAPPSGEAPPDTFLPVVADLIRRSLMEHLTPVTAALKRLEERIGFIGNRLKYPAGGPERQKPWRHEQPRHARPRSPANIPRPGQGQGQPWTPPSAASVQGHFAPRPLRGGGDPQVVGDEEDS